MPNQTIRNQVLRTIATLTNEDHAPPTLKAVATETALAISTVHYHVKHLRTEGLVAVDAAANEGRAAVLTTRGWCYTGLEPGYRRDTPLGSVLARVRLPDRGQVALWPSRDRVLLAAASTRRTCAPTLKEVAAAADVSLSTASTWVRVLRAEGMIAPCEFGATRSIELTQDGADALVDMIVTSTPLPSVPSR